MNLHRKVERLERSFKEAVCPVCGGHGGRRIVIEWPGEPVDLRSETACRHCGRCPPPEGVRIIDVSDVLNLGYSPHELLVAKVRITGTVSEAEQRQLEAFARNKATSESDEVLG